MTSVQIDPSFTGYGKTGVRLLKIRRSGKYHGIKQIEVSTELKLNNYDDYFRGDNASIVPTDTQKNTVYALAKQHQASKFIHFTVQIYWNKRKRLHKKRVQLPQDWFVVEPLSTVNSKWLTCVRFEHDA